MTHKDQPPTSDRLRIDIDRGLGGDKVAWPGPAAAPLGTDDEAGGAPPTAEERALAAAYEGNARDIREKSRAPRGWAWAAALFTSVALALLLWVATR